MVPAGQPVAEELFDTGDDTDEQTDDLVGVDGRFIPDNLHHLELGFGYLGKFFVHSKPPDLTSVIKMIIAFLRFGVNAAVSDKPLKCSLPLSYLQKNARMNLL